MFINACHLLSALPSLLQFGRRRLSLVAISFYALSLLFGPCRLSEFTLAGPRSHYRCMTPEGGSWDYPYRRIFADVIVYILRPNSKTLWSYIWTKCKSSKSWLSWAVCTISSFVKSPVFRREFLRKYLVYWAQIFRHNWNCYALSIFRVFIL